MPTTINLFHLKVHSISCNGSLNIGETVINSPTSSTKSTGANSSYGDFSPSDSLMENIYIDPDQNDQSNIANLDEFIASQS
ncbi:spore germination protein [Metabacillus sp. 84]|uniref:spore germination protein n=1 Tax=unclassified Metabacillus TaxID=2675274 RepID=UPI003CF2A956